MARRKQPAISDEPPEQRRRMRVDLLTAISESLLLSPASRNCPALRRDHYFYAIAQLCYYCNWQRQAD